MKEVTQYKFFKALTELSWIDAIWLYGSRARGDHRERSDIDLAIVAPRATDHDWHAVDVIVENADTLLQIDCVRFETLKPDAKITQRILRDKKVLFERKP